ncbi:N-acetylmuramoyl-L-alanine amidase family protein, partial [Clostridium folliculivorans]|uniref:N-acetylmuramoyl-L-alanine amidase family protein n=1 Tax=Clostridium folliculivorans TaxID=2886038 RepID=UPI0021C48931
LRIDSTTNSGQVISQSRNVVFNNIPKLDINSISNWGEVKGSTYIGGWALSGVGIKVINVSVDDTIVGQATYGYPTSSLSSRVDYAQRMNAGYGYWLNTANYSNGYHTITVTTIGNDNSKNSLTYTVNFNNVSKLIVVDPGHNNGGDDGAYSTIDGITYSERELNMQVAVKVKNDLEKVGYKVMLTRQPWDISYEPSDISLKNRADFANNLNANLFISIHHDISSDISTSGISTHYSTYRPNIDNDGIVSGVDPGGWSYDNLQIDSTPGYAASKSRELANKLVSNVSSSMGSANLKAHDHGLYVTRYTNMPSTLIECGFISNKSDALNAANADYQEKLAQSIANTINSIQFN